MNAANAQSTLKKKGKCAERSDTVLYYDVQLLNLLLKADNKTQAKTIRGKKRAISQKIITFDIETTSFLIDKKTGERYDYLQDSVWKDPRLSDTQKDNIVTRKMKKCYKLSIMYVWQICIEGECYHARTWEEFDNFISLLKSFDCTWIVWVHNLGFEWEYLRNRFEWSDCFFTRKHSPIYCITDNVIFRCTYKMTNLGLKDVGEKYNLPHHKLDGNKYNYNLIRHNKTPLLSYEMEYIRYDVLVLYEYIALRRETEKGKNGKPINIWNFPLTATGEPRASIKGEIENEHRQSELKKAIKPGIMSDYEEYLRMKQATKGGYTHCNPWYHAVAVFARPEKGIHIYSRDKTSFYPYIMLTKEFPYAMRPCEDSAIDKLIQRGDAVIFHCTFKGLRLKNDGFPYHSEHKGVITGEKILDNGKLIYADEVTDIITELDFETYEENYTWDDCIKFNGIYGVKKRLPLPYLLSILDWYVEKTIYKGDDEKIVIYQNSKGKINSIFGVSCTDPCKLTIYYIGGRWLDDEELQEEAHRRDPENEPEFNIKDYTEEQLLQLIERYSDGANPYRTELCNLYQWGLYVTAYARNIMVEHNCAVGTENVLYNDTDSTKYITWSEEDNRRINEYFDTYHRTVIIPEIKAAIEYINNKIANNSKWNKKHAPVTMDDFAPANAKGEKFTIGLMDIEDEYISFKSLGSKRYLYTEWAKDKKTGEKYIKIVPTVAGISKAKMREYLIQPVGERAIYTREELQIINDRFNPSVHVDMLHSGKNTHTYHNEYPEPVTLTDYTGQEMTVDVGTGVCITRQPFSMSSINKYAEFIAGKRFQIHDLQPTIDNFRYMQKERARK